MNCKQGDMAIVVRSDAGNEGKVLTCVRYVGEGKLVNKTFVAYDPGRHIWEVDQSMYVIGVDGKHQGVSNYAFDSQLRPLRGDLTDNEEEIVKELYTA